jgi:DNA polymerase-3 subunit beta
MTTATATKTKASSTSLTIPRTELLQAVQAASKAISRGPKPVLTYVKIGNGLVTGTDLEVRIDVAIGEMCDPCLVPADRLLSILRAATGDTVTLKTTGSGVAITCGGGKWQLPTEDVNEYPTWEPAEMKPVCRLPADQFARAVKATVYATDNETSRFALGGVLIDVTGGNPTWVGTDGRRMATVETETDQAVDDSQAVVPARILRIAAGMASGDGSVQVEANSQECRLELDGVTVTGRLIEGRFPRWRDVIGEPEGSASVVSTADLIGAVRAAAIVTSEQSKGITLKWAGDTLTLSAQSSEHGESLVKCPMLQAGDAADTKLDPHFLEQYLANLPPDEEPQVDVYAKDAQSRVLLRCGPYCGVIMPLAKDA